MLTLEQVAVVFFIGHLLGLVQGVLAFRAGYEWARQREKGDQ